MFTYVFGKLGDFSVMQLKEHRMCRKCCRMFLFDGEKGKRIFVPELQVFLFEHEKCGPIKNIEFKRE